MNEAEFLTLADTCGGDLSRWPDWARRPAVDLLRRSPACRAALAAATDLDRLIESGRPSISGERAQRLAAGIVAAQEDRLPIAVARWPIGRRTTGVFLAGMLLLGVSIGLLGPSSPISPEGLFDVASGEGMFGGLL